MAYVFLLAVGLDVSDAQLAQEGVDPVFGILLHLLGALVLVFGFGLNLHGLRSTLDF